MSAPQFLCYFALGAIAFFQMGRWYQYRLTKPESDAARRIREKYQAHKGSTERV